MVWTTHSDTMVGSWINGVVYHGWGDALETSAAAAWAAAKASVESDWSAGGMGDPPAFPWISSSGDIADAGGGDYYATAEMIRAAYTFQITNIWAGVLRDVDLYVLTSADGYGVYDNNGITELIENKWACWLTDAPATEATTVEGTTQLAAPATTKPVWCAQPDVDGSGWKGLMATNEDFVFRWNVTNGFVYQ